MRLFFISVSISWLLLGCNQPAETFKEVIRPIAWTQVQQSSFDQVRRLSGVVYPVEATNLSFEVGGKLEWVKVKLGDSVKKGDALARLDQRNFDLGLQSSQANLQKAQAALSEASNEYQRYAELSEKGLVSKSGFDNAKAAFESATSAVSLARTQLNISKKDLSDTLLVAPYDGKITKRLVEPSMQVSPGQATFEIEGEDGLEIQVMVPETLIRDLIKGSQVNIHYPAFPQILSSGAITEVGSRAETANAFPVTILINTSLDGLRAGMTAEVDFTFEGVGRTGYTGMTFRLPIAALGAGEKQKSYVFVYDTEKEVLHKRFVQTESILNNEVLVSSGLENGEIIAIAGVSFLRDGQTVTLLDKHVKRFN
ncbi:MAG: efflux RND transporter periplasmic adaptor subunit [Colwellia sp.]|nr:efflux RND transporter periplasmic adaptor subunit [Colwellia sp.]